MKPDNKPERCQADMAMQITGHSRRSVQNMAAAGKIPGAAKLGGIWTFDEAKLRRWVASEEEKAWRGTSIGAARHGGAEFRSPDKTTDAAYARLIGRKRPDGLRNGAQN